MPGIGGTPSSPGHGWHVQEGHVFGLFVGLRETLESPARFLVVVREGNRNELVHEVLLQDSDLADFAAFKVDPDYQAWLESS